MKKCLILLLSLLLLCGCTAKKAEPKTPALEFRQKLAEAGGCAFTAELTADYGEQVYVFTLECAYQTGGDGQFTVTAPKELAGIAGTVSAQGSRVTFEDLQLDLGQLANGYVAPLETPWLLGACWSGGYIQSVGKDEDHTVITYLHGYNEGELVVETWLDSAGTPVHCDISYDGRRCLTAEIRQFQLQ